mgnify:FL=1
MARWPLCDLVDGDVFLLRGTEGLLLHDRLAVERGGQHKRKSGVLKVDEAEHAGN